MKHTWPCMHPLPLPQPSCTHQPRAGPSRLSGCLGCSLQIYTPPYLTGNVSRPIIRSLSSTSPGYGASVTVVFGWTGPAGTVNRVVVNRVGGVTHSLHVDQRQARTLSSRCLKPSHD